MTKKNELVATAHLKKKTKREILAVPVQKDWNKACREKEKSDRDKGMNADGERRQFRQENKDYNDENTLFKAYSLCFIINYF